MSSPGLRLLGDPDGPAAGLGGRAQAKQRTRTAILARSLSLFSARGYDAVTTQEIAEAAGVTQRTLFRYFERKDSIIYGSAYDYVARFEMYLDRAIMEHDDPFEAIRAAFCALAVYFTENRPIIAKIYAIIQTSDQLKAIERTHQTRIDWLVASALNGRSGYFARDAQPTLSARLRASVLFGAIRPVVRAWLNGELPGDLIAYSELSWCSMRPLFAASQAYAANLVDTFSTVPPRTDVTPS